MTIFEEYAVLDAQIKALSDQKDALRVDILNELIDQGVDKVDTQVGRFTISKLKSWTYPEKVLALSEKFKVEKAKAESTGDATYVENESLRFTPIKL